MKVTVYSTKGQQKFEHETSATNWGVLKSELKSVFDFNTLNATENITRRDLTVDTAILPTEDFILFLRPKTTKSGAYTYKEAKAIVKADKNIQQFIKDAYATDYTHLSTAQLNEAIGRTAGVPLAPQTVEIANEDNEGDCTEEEKDIVKILNETLQKNGYRNFTIFVNIFPIEEDNVPEKEEVSPEEAERLQKEAELARLQKEADEIFG